MFVFIVHITAGLATHLRQIIIILDVIFVILVIPRREHLEYILYILIYTDCILVFVQLYASAENTYNLIYNNSHNKIICICICYCNCRFSHAVE